MTCPRHPGAGRGPWRLLLLLLALGLPPLAHAAEPVLTLEYTLDNRYQTSAGVYDAGGHLIRTLWSNRTREEGSHTDTWDGLDDFGQPWTGEGEVEVKLLAHNVNYRWEGVIGNTSKDQNSPTKLDYQNFMRDFEVSGDRVYTIRDAEGWIPYVRYHKVDDLNAGWAPRPGLINFGGMLGSVSRVASDGERVYVARSGVGKDDPSGNAHVSFVAVLDKDLTREIVLPASQPICTHSKAPVTGLKGCYDDGRTSSAYQGVVDLVDTFRAEMVRKGDVTGLAAQSGGRLLFTARAGAGELHVIDKTTGALLSVTRLAKVGDLATCRDPKRPEATEELWAIHGVGDSAQRVVSRFDVSPQSGAVDATPGLTLTGVHAPLNLALSPDCSLVAIVSGGDQQQVIAFDTDSGRRVWHLGDEGGYRSNGPEVKAGRFSFTDNIDPNTGEISEYGFVAFADDGDLFVGDPGLTRVQRFDAQHSVVDHAMWSPVHYNIRVDQNDPSRVFRGYHEYRIDFGRPLAKAWQLVRYYGDALALNGPAGLQRHVNSGFTSLATLPNGMTYGLAGSAKAGFSSVFAVPRDAPLKLLERQVPGTPLLDARGNLQSVRYGKVGEHFVEFLERRLEGFDAEGAPRWARGAVVNRIRRMAVDPRVNPYFSAARIHGLLRDGLRVLFDPRLSAPGAFHLAAARPGADHWLWRASPEVGRFNLEAPTGNFDTAKTWYPAMAVTGLGDHVLYQYHGEHWQTDIHGPGAPSQANQFLHFHRSGLFLGQFGTPNQVDLPPAAPGQAGNSFSIQMVEANGATYFIHNDGHAHAGMHVWRLNGIEHIRMLVAKATLPGAAALVPSRTDATDSRDLKRPDQLVAEQRGGTVILRWSGASAQATAVEVEALRPTYTGNRFVQVASVSARSSSWIDENPLLGQPAVYRVRFLMGNEASDYSPHAAVRVRVGSSLVYEQNFEGEEWRQREGRLPKWTCVGARPPQEICGVSPVPGEGSAFRLSLSTADKPGVQVSRGWLAPSLLSALNRAMARPRGGPPEQFQVSFDYWLSPFPRGGEVQGRLEIDPGGGMHTFARLGGLFRLRPVGDLDPSTGLVHGHARQVLSVIPNGRPQHGVVHYTFPEAPRMNVFIGFHGEDVPAGVRLEIRVDNFRVERLTPVAAGTR